jgi:hypothetical protein
MNSDEEGGGRVIDESASKESGRKGGGGEGSRSEGGGCIDESNEHDDDTIGTIRMIVLVGIPGSGKSFVANIFKNEGWIVVCQDELGDRRKCEAAARQAYADVC